MKYCVSNIHGRLDLFEELLDQVSFSESDELFILGDCIGQLGGLSVLTKIISMQASGMKNVKLIKGDYEKKFALAVRQYDQEAAQKLMHKRDVHTLIDGIAVISNVGRYANSMRAANTISELGLYQAYEDLTNFRPSARNLFLDYLESLPEFEVTRANGQAYWLVHAGLINCRPNLNVREEWFLNESSFRTPSVKHLYPNTTVIFGHTTTRDIRIATEGAYLPQSIWYDTKHNTDKIGIDCGCSFYGGKLACLRLDDMHEFYIPNQRKLVFPVADLNRFLDEKGMAPKDLCPLHEE